MQLLLKKLDLHALFDLVGMGKIIYFILCLQQLAANMTRKFISLPCSRNWFFGFGLATGRTGSLKGAKSSVNMSVLVKV